MTEQPQQHSGSRWEPVAGDGLATRPLQGVVLTAPHETAPRPGDGQWFVAAPPPPPARRAGHRLLVAGAALGLVLAGGAAGFAAGRAAAPDAGATTVPADSSPFDGGPGARQDFGGRGGRNLPDGTSLPRGGTLPDGTGTDTTNGTTTT